MTINELAKTRFDLTCRRNNLRLDYAEAKKKARDYYNEHLLPAEKSSTISDEEMDAIYDTYENLSINEALLEKQIDIADEAIEALSQAEAALAMAKVEGIWREE